MLKYNPDIACRVPALPVKIFSFKMAMAQKISILKVKNGKFIHFIFCKSELTDEKITVLTLFWVFALVLSFLGRTKYICMLGFVVFFVLTVVPYYGLFEVGKLYRAFVKLGLMCKFL